MGEIPSGYHHNVHPLPERRAELDVIGYELDLWFWHAFFGLPGSHNDINFLNVSPLFTNLLNGVTLKCNFKINRNNYDRV
jgi:hypothetical protein